VLAGLRSLPALPEMQRRETQALETRHDAVDEALRRSPSWPGPQDPCLTVLRVPPDGGLVTTILPQGLALPVFTSHVKAEDYRLALLPRRGATSITLSAVELAVRLREHRDRGLVGWTVNPCPRCSAFALYGIEQVRTGDDVLTMCGIVRATERLRIEVGVQIALEMARAGDLRMASYVACCCLQHITLEEPQLHLLFGRLGILHAPRTAAKEAPAFLRLLQELALAERLEREIVTGTCNFDDIVVPMAER
jgi:hypothetical protein